MSALETPISAAPPDPSPQKFLQQLAQEGGTKVVPEGTFSAEFVTLLLDTGLVECQFIGGAWSTDERFVFTREGRAVFGLAER